MTSMIFAMIVLGLLLTVMGVALLVKRRQAAGVIVLLLGLACLALPVFSYVYLWIMISTQ
jgi:uncharacterized membrane protein HdeD (DUF308 family)